MAPGVSSRGGSLYLPHLESHGEEQVHPQAPWPERQDNEEHWPRCPPKPQDGARGICPLAHRLPDVHQSRRSAWPG